MTGNVIACCFRVVRLGHNLLQEGLKISLRAAAI